MMNTNLVIGFGSEILSDQSVIPDLVNDLRSEFTDNIDFSSELISSLDLIGLFEGYDNLLILDTVQQADQKVGVMRYFPISEYEPGLHLENYHDSSIIESIEIAKELGIDMPGEIGIVTINTEEVYTLSTSYCPELTRKYPELLQQMKTLIKHFFQLNTKRSLVVK